MSKTNNILERGKEIIVALGNNEELTLEIKNPMGGQVSCTIIKGAGDVSLYKKGNRLVKLKDTYSLSSEPGLPTTITLNTNIRSDDNGWELLIQAHEPDLEENKSEQNEFKVNLLIPFGLHTVHHGDSLYIIARSYDMTIKELMELNPNIKNPNMIEVGQCIKVKSSVRDDLT